MKVLIVFAALIGVSLACSCIQCPISTTANVSGKKGIVCNCPLCPEPVCPPCRPCKVTPVELTPEEPIAVASKVAPAAQVAPARPIAVSPVELSPIPIIPCHCPLCPPLSNPPECNCECPKLNKFCACPDCVTI